jgi:hypothetical protein
MSDCLRIHGEARWISRKLRRPFLIPKLGYLLVPLHSIVDEMPHASLTRLVWFVVRLLVSDCSGSASLPRSVPLLPAFLSFSRWSMSLHQKQFANFARQGNLRPTVRLAFRPHEDGISRYTESRLWSKFLFAPPPQWPRSHCWSGRSIKLVVADPHHECFEPA